MAVQARCSECDRVYTLADDMVGKKVRCKGCDTVFQVRSSEGKFTASARSAPEKPARAGRGRAADVDDDEDEVEERPRRRRQERRDSGSNAALWWILGGAAALGVLMAAAGVGVFLLRSPSPAPAPVASAPPVGQGGMAPGNPPVVPPAWVAPGNPPVAAAPGNPPAGAPANLYGDQGGEEVAPADATLPNTALRATADDTFYRLSNPRIGRRSRGPGQALLVDYEVTRRGKHRANTLVLHSNGRRSPVHLLVFGRQDKDTIEVTTFGFASRFPENAELYLTRNDARYGKFAPTFKVSNSVTMGNMQALTKARNWTAEEIARYTKDPPNHTSPNAHPTVGTNTAFAGTSTGGAALRYVEPNGHLLGLEHRPGEWDKEKCIGGLVAVFRRDQESTLPDRVMAKDGYAVGGMEVKSQKFVDAIRLHFMRIKPDGSLDKGDTYTSDWFGQPQDGKETTLANDGRKVLGIVLVQGAVLNGVALVTDGGPPAK